jgi:CysZ protein
LLGVAVGYGAEYVLDGAVDQTQQDGYFEAATGFARMAALVLIPFFGFRLIAVPVIGFFADEVVAAVEAKHYPNEAARAVKTGFGVSMRLGVMSAVRLVLFNLLALPLYIILIFTAIGPLILFLLVNALLLGRDMGDMVAVRHLSPAACREWRATTRWPRMLLGLIVTGLFMVPVANIVAPIIGAAMATHMFHGARYRGLLGV